MKALTSRLFVPVMNQSRKEIVMNHAKILKHYLVAGMALFGEACQTLRAPLSENKKVTIGDDMYQTANGVTGPFETHEKNEKITDGPRRLAYQKTETGEIWYITAEDLDNDGVLNRRNILGYQYIQKDQVTNGFNITSCYGSDFSTAVYKNKNEKILSNHWESDIAGFYGERARPLQKLFPDWQEQVSYQPVP